MLFFGQAVLSPGLCRSLLPWPFNHGGLLKIDGNAAGTDWGFTIQRQQQRGLEKTQALHEIDVKRRRQRIPLVESLLNHGAGFMQASVIDGDSHDAV